MTNKDELRKSINAFERMPARMGEEAMKMCTHFCNTHARTLVEHSNAHLELLELGVTVEDIKALIEARDNGGCGPYAYHHFAKEIISKWEKV